MNPRLTQRNKRLFIIFVKFLNEYNITLEQLAKNRKISWGDRSNVREQDVINILDILFATKCKPYVFHLFFIFSYSMEGADFWLKISLEWKHYYYNELLHKH